MFQLPYEVGDFADACAALAAQRRFLVQFPLSRGPCILLRRTAVNVAFILTASAESSGSVLRLTDTVRVKADAHIACRAHAAPLALLR